MAKEGAEKKTVSKEVVIEPKGIDSLTPLLEEDAKKYMIGHPAEEPLEEKEEEKEEEKDLALEKEKAITDEEEPELKEEKVEKPPKPKYKSQEEAETAYAEAQRKMHEATTESSRLREQNEKLQAQFNEVLTKAVTPKEEGVKPEITKKEEAILKGRIKPMLQEIEALDTTSPDYQEKVDEIYDKHLGATLRERDTRMEKDFSDRLSKVKEEIKKEIKEEQRTEKTQDELVSDAIKKAKEEGLDMRTGIKIEGRDKSVSSADWRLFWDSTRDAPKDSSPEQIVDYAIKEVKRMRNEILAPKDKARKRQEENTVLERTTVGKEVRAEDEVTRPISMTEALDKSVRRI